MAIGCGDEQHKKMNAITTMCMVTSNVTVCTISRRSRVDGDIHCRVATRKTVLMTIETPRVENKKRISDNNNDKANQKKQESDYDDESKTKAFLTFHSG